MTLSRDAAQLLERARSVEHAVDLYLAPGAVRLEADRVAEVLRDADAHQLDDHALWNLLFAAGELSHQVDVYRAHELFSAARAAVDRLSVIEAGTPRAAIVEMCFDFFFARRGDPLLPLRANEVITALGALLEHPARPARRAAIHGLGHLVALGRDQAWSADAVALLDEFVSASPDVELRRYADEARSGELQ